MGQAHTTIVSATSAHVPAQDILHQSATCRVFVSGPCRTVVCKEPLGEDGARRAQHERDMLARLHGIEGVVQRAQGNYRKHLVALQDCGRVTLAQALRAGPCEPVLLLSLATQLARILGRVHAAGVIHRDVHPANIMLAGGDRAVLIDFDLAVPAGRRVAHEEEPRIVGTLAYLAPERTGRTGSVADHRADLYALGVTLYEMATGRLPFEAREPVQLMHDHMVREPAAPALLDARVPRRLSDIILRLLAKEPERR